MSPLILAAVLFAALLHASWNAIIKVSGDRLVAMAVTTAFTALLAFPLLFILPTPAVESWPYLGLSALVHSFYMLVLIKAYSHGDFAQVYPLSRGSAPLLTVVLGFVLLGESLRLTEIAGVLVIVTGIFALALERNFQAGKGTQTIGLSPIALFYSLLTGVSIASYSMIDGVGARLSGNNHSFTAWMFFLDGFIIPLVAISRRQNLFISTAKTVWKQGLLVGFISAIAYWIIIWAFTQQPIALIAALRETSVLFAALISVFILKELFTAKRAIVILFIVTGIILLAL